MGVCCVTTGCAISTPYHSSGNATKYRAEQQVPVAGLLELADRREDGVEAVVARLLRAVHQPVQLVRSLQSRAYHSTQIAPWP